MVSLPSLSFAFAALGFVAWVTLSSLGNPKPDQLAKSGWPALPKGETPATIVVPKALTIQRCTDAGACKTIEYSVLQDGGFRATSPKPQGRITTDGMSLITTYNGDNRFYIGQPHLANSKIPITRFANDFVAFFDLTNKVWEFDVDMSKVGCNCDASMYFYSFNPSSSQTSTDKDVMVDPMRNHWYLDAQSTPGVPEMDVMEGCGRQWTSSIHTCKSVVNATYSGCSGMGELWRALSPFDLFNRAYGPGGKTINTNRRFHVAASFNVNGGRWTMQVSLSQTSAGDDGSLQSVASSFKTEPRADVDSLKWMRPAMSLWGNPNNGITLTPFYAPQCNPLGKGCAYKEAEVAYSSFKLTDLPPSPRSIVSVLAK